MPNNNITTEEVRDACEKLGCLGGVLMVSGEWWDQPVKISTVIHWLAHCTTPDIRGAMADMMTDQGYDAYWAHCSKTTFWDITSEWLAAADKIEPPVLDEPTPITPVRLDPQ